MCFYLKISGGFFQPDRTSQPITTCPVEEEPSGETLLNLTSYNRVNEENIILQMRKNTIFYTFSRFCGIKLQILTSGDCEDQWDNSGGIFKQISCKFLLLIIIMLITLLLSMKMKLIANKNTIITKQLLDPSLLTPKKRMAEARTLSGQCGREIFIVLESVW